MPLTEEEINNAKLDLADLGAFMNADETQSIATRYGGVIPSLRKLIASIVAYGGLPPSAPANTVAPSITGTPEVGLLLTGDDGTWTGAPTSYSRQWKRGGAPISGAIGSTYTPVAADIGENITFQVTATNAGGSTPATSVAVGPVVLYPLDAAGTLPMFAYGPRKLTATYSGPSCLVVRPSDSATLDLGFVGQDLDVAALDTFLGSEIGRIDKWYDQSGNGNDATQPTNSKRPKIENGGVEGGPILFNNRRPVVFDLSEFALPAGVTANRNAVSVFMVAETICGPQTLGSLIQLGSGDNQFAVFQNTVDLGASGMPSLTKPIEQRPALYEVIGNGATGTLSQDFDTTTGGISAAPLVGGMIGNLDILGGYQLTGYVSAVIGYPRVPSSGEAGGLRGDLRELFGLVNVANSGRVICVGDSIVAASIGTAYGYGFMKMAQRHLPNDIAFYNMGVGGAELGSGASPKLATYAIDGAGYILPKFADNRVVFMMYGTNDITASSRTAAEVYDDLQTYAGNVRGQGGKVIVVTILPRAEWDSTKQATRDSLNNLLRTNWASFADGLCDFAVDATMGPQAAAANPLLYGDGTHPTRLGHTYLEPIARASLLALL